MLDHTTFHRLCDRLNAIDYASGLDFLIQVGATIREDGESVCLEDGTGYCAEFWITEENIWYYDY